MSILFRTGALIVGVAALMTVSPKISPQDSMLQGIPGGKTRVIGPSYAINEKLVPWPGDEKYFEAKTNATVEKNGYFTRSFWMLEHYGTHLDAPVHFPPGQATVDQIPANKFFGPAVLLDIRAQAAQDA